MCRAPNRMAQLAFFARAAREPPAAAIDRQGRASALQDQLPPDCEQFIALLAARLHRPQLSPYSSAVKLIQPDAASRSAACRVGPEP